MAIALHVDKLDDDGKIRVRHTFYGETLQECYDVRDAHADGCRAFGPALKEDRVIEDSEIIPDLPEWEAGDDDK